MQEISLDAIKHFCSTNKLQWTNHMEVRLLQRGILTDDVEYALMDCEIIERYPESYPYPSCLVLGMTRSNEYLHVVCGATEEKLWLITAYYPDTNEWEGNLKFRKEQSK